VAGCFEDGAHEVGRGGLAVGAGDAHDPQPPAGITRTPGRHQPQRQLGIPHHQFRDLDAGDRPLHDDGGGTGGHGSGHVLVAVGVLPAACHEEVAGLHLS